MMPTTGFYSGSLVWGGSEAYLHTLLWDRQSRGERSVLFCPPDYQMLKRGMLPPGCSVVTAGRVRLRERAGMGPAPSRSNGRGARQVLRESAPPGLRLVMGTASEVNRLTHLFRRMLPVLLHFNDTGCEPGPVAARLAGVRVVVGTLHTLPGTSPDKLDCAHRAIEHVSMRCMDAAIAVSEYTKRAWVERVRIDARRVRVIYNGMDLDAFRPSRPAAEVRKELALPVRAPVLGVTARLHPIKGHRYLLDAMPQVLSAVPGAHLVLAGDGLNRPALEQQARALASRTGCTSWATGRTLRT